MSDENEPIEPDKPTGKTRIGNPDGVIGTGAQAEQARREFATYNQKDIPKIPDSLRALPPIRIYNVFDQRWVRGMGGMGEFTVQACKHGMLHSDPLDIPYIMTEAIVINDHQMEHRLHDGRDFAENIIGAAKYSGATDMRKWGVFIAAGQAPTLKEIAAANEALLKTQVEMSQQALEFWSAGTGSLDMRCNITPQHIKALQFVAERLKR